MGVLFVSYTGLLEPLGRSQVLPYVLGLADKGHEMTLLSFERGSQTIERRQMQVALQERKVEWIALRYHKHPPVVSTAIDVLSGLAATLRQRGVDLIHARSHVPAVVADVARSVRGIPFLFDHRGLMADEYADAGVWRRGGILYRITERLESRFLRTSRHVVVLTDRYRRELGEPDYVVTIPCAVDLSRFRPAHAGDPRPFDLVYAGAATGLYLLHDALRFFETYRELKPEARLLLLSAEPHAGGDLPVGAEARRAKPEEVPALLRLARVGLSFRQTGRAQLAASPVKVSEYLATGLPVVSTSGVGDLDELLPTCRVGVVVSDTSRDALVVAAKQVSALLNQADLVDRCRRVAEQRYDLIGAVASYDRLYREILGGKTAAYRPS